MWLDRWYFSMNPLRYSKLMWLLPVKATWGKYFVSAFIRCSEHMYNYCMDKLCCYLSLYDIYYYCCYLLPSLSPVFSILSFPHQLRCESSTLWPSCTTSAVKWGTSAQQHAAGVCGGALAQLSPAVSIHVPCSAAQCREAQNLMGNPLFQSSDPS